MPDGTIQRLANCVIDLGPGGGESGGHILAQCTPEDIAKIPDAITRKNLNPHVVPTR